MDSQAPILHHANRHPWQFFCTLTFAGKVPSPGQALALQKRWLDRSSPTLLQTAAQNVHWLSREELGELNGRFHLHLLLASIPQARVNPRTCLALMSEWEKLTAKATGRAGMARVRVFTAALSGPEYVLKGLSEKGDWSLRGANCYELGKFGGEGSQTVRLARALAVVWSRRKGHKYARQARSGRDAQGVKCVTV